MLGRDLRSEGLTDDEARAELQATMPEAYASAFLRFYVDGELDESPVLPTVGEVLGRPPHDFAGWVLWRTSARSRGDRGAGMPRRPAGSRPLILPSAT